MKQECVTEQQSTEIRVVDEDETDIEERDEEEDEEEYVSCYSCKKIFETNNELIYHNENICNSCAIESRVCVGIDECRSDSFLVKMSKSGFS